MPEGPRLVVVNTTPIIALRSQMNYEAWRAVPSDQLLRCWIADLDAWTSKSRQVPALCFSPPNRQKGHRCDGVIVPVSSSETSAVAHCVYKCKIPFIVLRDGEVYVKD